MCNRMALRRFRAPHFSHILIESFLMPGWECVTYMHASQLLST